MPLLARPIRHPNTRHCRQTNNSNWENVAYMVILILIVVFLFDAASNALRHRLMGTKAAGTH